MATFRKYGGTNYSPISNIVRHNILNSKSSSFNTSGLYNSKETFLSHIDMSGNSLLHVGKLFFQDGTSISTGTNSNNGLSAVLGYNPSADGKSMINVGSVGYIGGTTQTSAYTGWNPSINTSYTLPTITFNTNGQITNVIDNSLSPSGLGDVLTTSGDGNNKSMYNLGNITQSPDFNFYQYGSGIISQTGTGANIFKDTSFEGNITQADTKTIVQFGISGSNTFRDTSFGGNITQADNKTIVQFGSSGSNTFRDTSFGGNITQADNKTIVQFGTNGTNIFKNTEFNGNITQLSGSNNLKSTLFEGSITQANGIGSNILNDTSFNGLCRYISGVSIIGDNDIPNKAYVDTIASGLNPVAFCDCATTGNIVLSLQYLSLEVDGYPVQYGNRVLVKSQDALTNNQNTNNTENGIYVYNSSGYLSRAPDCDTGDNITNQYSFIENGTLNGLKAFIQTNSIPSFTPGTNSLLYAPFYSANFQLGNGLEFVSGTPTTLQVKSNLDFLNSVKIDNPGGTSNYPLRITKYDVSKVLHVIDISNNTDFNGITKSGDNCIISYKPLSIAHHGSGITSGVRIDISNVILQASPTNYYDLSFSTGHNFYGKSSFSGDTGFYGTNNNIYGGTTSLNATTTNFNSPYNYFYNNITMNSSDFNKRQISTSYLNVYDIGTTYFTDKSTQIYQSGQQLLFDNNSNTTSNYGTSFGFYCNNLGSDDVTKQTNPLSFNSSSFSVDVSNNTGGPLVRYHAFNNTNYGTTIGHNFTGNCYFYNETNFYSNILLNTSGKYIQFPDGTKQYTAAYSNQASSISSSSQNKSSQNDFTVFTGLNTNYSYCISGYIYFQNTGGNCSITYSIEFRANVNRDLVYRISNSTINYQYIELNIPFSFITTGISEFYIRVFNKDNIGTWSIVGYGYTRYIRI